MHCSFFAYYERSKSMVFNGIYGPNGVPKACIFDIYFPLAKAISIHQFSTAIELISTPVGGFLVVLSLLRPDNLRIRTHSITWHQMLVLNNRVWKMENRR